MSETFRLTQKQRYWLTKIHRQSKNAPARFADRIKVILSLNKGLTHSQIAEVLLMDESTVGRIKKLYEERGHEGLEETHYQGGSSLLSDQQKAELADHLDQQLYGSAAEICEYVQKRFGVTYTPQGMVQFLDRLGFSWKKTKIVPGKADAEKQKAFVKKYKKTQQNLGPNAKSYFMDACHPTHNVMPAYAWIRRGEEREVKSNSGRKRINLNGVYSPKDHEIIVRDDETINAQSTIKLFKKIEKLHPELVSILIYCDNAGYYRSKLVKEYLKTSRITLIFLPAYSPNLNLIERLWKYFKRRVLYNRYYATFESFRDGALAFFKNCRKKHLVELQSLMTENFHIFKST